MKETIKAKITLGIPLTDTERALYILYFATDEEARRFFNKLRQESASGKTD